MQFDNSFFALGEAFFQSISPTAVAKPQLLLFNQALAEQLNFDCSLSTSVQAQLLSGNQLFSGSQPLAMAYAGHQFGHFNPQLGDGRAHLLGEIIDQQGQRLDLQLKGSGQTAYSRNGDGRYALGPALREYIMSAAMQGLGIASSQCLALVTTGEIVYRQQAELGAIISRVAQSHLRVGSFEYHARRGDSKRVQQLVDYAILRHFPQINSQGEQRLLDFLQQCINKQVQLVLHWLRVGFIHGVLNTDNCAISGQTIDFGPCAMMDSYNPKQVFSSIDEYGRYAFEQQGKILKWNMARLAECLIPLCQQPKNDFIKQLQAIIASFDTSFERGYQTMLCDKFGFSVANTENFLLAKAMLEQMAILQLDYSNTFIDLQHSLRHLSAKEPAADASKQQPTKHYLDSRNDLTFKDNQNTQLATWHHLIQQWQQQLQTSSIPQAANLMQQHNPQVIPRNHLVEQCISACLQQQDLTPTYELLEALAKPYCSKNVAPHLQQNQPIRHYQTFCGT